MSFLTIVFIWHQVEPPQFLSEFSQQIVDSNPTIGAYLFASDDCGTVEVKGVVAEARRHHHQDLVCQPFIFYAKQPLACCDSQVDKCLLVLGLWNHFPVCFSHVHSQINTYIIYFLSTF